ncbi:MAG TPA: sigma-70 family RNA polymerase sigma factor [Polyangia bacterium]|jgi:RNA polymerase sigma-70 factor (ECF subfamily)|nr:sigma-70 family RNA polymerase sigma factor [Polyangia bacterium]
MGALDQTSRDVHRLDDDALLAAVLDKDDRAWREMMRRYRLIIFRCVTRVSWRFDSFLSNADINEIFSELCMNLLRDDMRKLRAYDRRRGARLASWLGLLAVNTAYDYLRKASRRPVYDLLENAPEEAILVPDGSDEVLHRQRWGMINSLMRDFSEADRRFVHLYYEMGLLPEEVANEMHISVKTVYARRSRMRVRLEELACEAELQQAA